MHTFEVDGRAVFEDKDLMKALYAQGFGYSKWWNAAMLDRLNDMLRGGFLKVEGAQGADGPYRIRISHSTQLRVSRKTMEVLLFHRNVEAQMLDGDDSATT